MPCLSFSAMEILPALLNHKKMQTIRPLWNKKRAKDVSALELEECRYGKKDCIKVLDNGDMIFQTKPRLKAGDIVTLYWRQRSSPKGSWFCKKCGEPVKKMIPAIYFCENKIGIITHNTKPSYSCVFESVKSSFIPTFPKLLGKVKITEVFEIIMSEMDNHFQIWGDNIPHLTKYDIADEIAILDGFKGTEVMFNWFHKNYDLSQPKKFAVYRWRWLSGR